MGQIRYSYMELVHFRHIIMAFATLIHLLYMHIGLMPVRQSKPRYHILVEKPTRYVGGLDVLR